MSLKRYVLLSLAIVVGIATAKAGGSKDDIESETKYRAGVELQFKLADGLKLSIDPEFRFAEGFDRALVGGGLSYKVLDFVTVGANYHMVIAREESDSYTGLYTGFGSGRYEADVMHRYSFDVTVKKEVFRFTPSFRVRYINYADKEIDDEAYMRYRVKVDYNIRKCKFTPYVSTEWYHSMEDNLIHKVRPAGGVEYKIDKHSAVSADYKLDIFSLKYKNAHIFGVYYNYSF